MGNRHPREARVVKTQRRATGRVPLAEQPFTIERINTSASVCDILCRAGVQRKQRNPNQPHTAAFDETSSVDSPLHLVSFLDTVSTTCGSGWVHAQLNTSVSTTYPPATAGSTDCIQVRRDL